MSTLVFVLYACIGNQDFCIPQWQGTFNTLDECRSAAYAILAHYDEAEVVCVQREGNRL